MSKNVNNQDHKKQNIPATDEAWDSGVLGCSEAHVRVSTSDLELEINDSLELHPISIRLNKSLIEDLKLIGELNGIGYQPLIRQVLKRFADCEKKRILQQVHSEEMKKQNKKPKKAA